MTLFIPAYFTRWF